MRTVLKISIFLSWFNLIVWGMGVCRGLLIAFATQNMAFLIIPFLLSVVVLHSYAALQLQRSIKDPARPLSSQTPAGIRFIGTIVLFLGFICTIYGIAFLQYPKDLLQIMQSKFPEAKSLTISDLRLTGGFSLLCGICISLNVIFNFRLLRWYHFMKGVM